MGVAVAALLVGAEGFAAEPPSVKPESGPWSSEKAFAFATDAKEFRQSVSGIACPESPSSEPRLCLIVFDEGAEARYARISNNSYSADAERVVLRASEGELDAEGAATDGSYYYVTGSHSPKRATCKKNLDSRYVIRFAVDATTGRASRDPAGDPAGSLVHYQDVDYLWRIMAELPGLKKHVGKKKCLGTEPPEKAKHLKGRRGANIEGLAVKDGRMFFGFRGPAKNGKTFILSVRTEAFFSGSDPQPELTRIVVGERRGIRDLYALEEGILILAGPDDDASSSDANWIVALWDGKGVGQDDVKPKVLAQLDLTGVKRRHCDRELKPEALTLLGPPTDHYHLLILSDGMCDGGPLEFKIPR
jgi:hypothetical protein